MINSSIIISVAICTYNGELFIEKQLNSILDQTYAINEIVICDDGSSDRTLEIAEQVLTLQNIDWTIERNSKNLGVTKNFEKAISMCHGDIIFTSDQDDIWREDKVEKMICAFDNKDCVLAFCDASIIDGNGELIDESLNAKNGFLQTGYSWEKYVDETIRLNYTVYGCTMAFRKSFANKIMPFYESKANHDAWIMCCAGLFGKVEYVDEKLISYRIHGGNTVSSIGENEGWKTAISEQNGFQRYFAMQKYRDIRIELLRNALLLEGIKNKEYVSECKKAVRFYSRICNIEKSTAAKGHILLTASLADGSYKYRFCDRGRTVNNMLLLKQYIYDVHFISLQKGI